MEKLSTTSVRSHFYAIGERIHYPGMEKERLEKFRGLWQKAPLRCMLTYSGMVGGSTRNRLENVMQVKDIQRVINLLCPDDKPGTWNRNQARECATLLKDFMSEKQKPLGLYLLGRKVIGAFTDLNLQFGDSYFIGDLPCLALPHPSGRGRYLNDPEKVETIRQKVKEFHDTCVHGRIV